MTSLSTHFGTDKFIENDDPPLSLEELKDAITELHKPCTPIFTKSDRKYVDPAILMQKIALFSFIPSPEAIPDKNGFYGFAKIRGTFATLEESDQRAIYITKNVDSVHKIYHVQVGHPFPITCSSDYSETVKEIDIRDEAINTISHSVRESGDKDMKIMNELKEREELLRKDCSSEEPTKSDPLDNYIISRKKIADNLFIFTEYRKKMEMIKTLILKAEAESLEIETSHPEVLQQYKEKYDEVSKKCGIDKAQDNMALMVKQYFNERPNVAEIFNNNQV